MTVNLPEEYQDDFEKIKTNILKEMTTNNLVYIIATELTKNSKQHFHCGYLARPQKSTSNETKKYNKYFPFAKKDHPNAVCHKKHNNFKILTGYIMKDGKYLTNINKEELITSKELYNNQIKDKQELQKKLEITEKYNLNLNQICNMFVEHFDKQTNTEYYIKNQDNWDPLILGFLRTISEYVQYSTYSRITHEKLINYTKFKSKKIKEYLKNFI